MVLTGDHHVRIRACSVVVLTRDLAALTREHHADSSASWLRRAPLLGSDYRPGRCRTRYTRYEPVLGSSYRRGRRGRCAASNRAHLHAGRLGLDRALQMHRRRHTGPSCSRYSRCGGWRRCVGDARAGATALVLPARRRANGHCGRGRSRKKTGLPPMDPRRRDGGHTLRLRRRGHGGDRTRVDGCNGCNGAPLVGGGVGRRERTHLCRSMLCI